MNGLTFQSLKRICVFATSVLFVFCFVLETKYGQAFQGAPDLGGGGGAFSSGMSGDGGDSPSLPSPNFDYVAYAVTDLPDHYTMIAQGNFPPTNDDNTPAANPITNAGATLGRVLFYDVRLSHNNTVSCASCHHQELGFNDPRKLSVGADGRKTGRHSMGLSNAKFYNNGRFRWDEAAATLEEQSLLPIQHVDEMNQDLASLLTKLDDASFYGALFQDAFGDTTITADRISMAMAQFTRSMVSYSSKFDLAYTNGTNAAPDFAGVFTTQEVHGLRLFGGQIAGPGRQLHCFRCHETVAHIGRQPINNGLDLDTIGDQGAGSGEFKTTSLRNISVRGKFMHDGRFSSLSEVIDHYDSGVKNHPSLSTFLKDQGQPIVLNLTAVEKAALLAFMDTLTDDTFLTSPLFADPFPIHLPEVDAVEVDDNLGQRASVSSITVKMNGVIDIEPDAFSVVQRSDSSGPTGVGVSTSFTTSVIDGQTVIAIAFGSQTRNAAGVLNDGNYELTIDSSKVFRDGRPMASSFVYGDAADETFYTYYGDSDGDRDVEGSDLTAFFQTYRKETGESGFNVKLDYDADGDVDNIDLGNFLLRYTTDLPF